MTSSLYRLTPLDLLSRQLTREAEAARFGADRIDRAVQQILEMLSDETALCDADKRSAVVLQLLGIQTEARRSDAHMRSVSSHLGSLQHLATQVSEAVTGLESQAVIDPLTKILNRRGFDESIRHLISSVRARDQSLALLYLDLDHFKKVNDRFGHDVGDDVLVGIAQHLSRSVRDGDVVARIGGKEFAVILTGADKAQAAEIANRLRPSKMVFQREGLDFPVSMSAGLAYRLPEEPDPKWRKRADSALYAAKTGGRNTLIIAPEGSSGVGAAA